ncbi:MAG TPA: amino acid adenylation domain-containing protein, partial [Longimicrobiaceae bacterium]|nr:amino acid adenylation domain-containing protein [Longimicrobiaceae bacterium]
MSTIAERLASLSRERRVLLLRRLREEGIDPLLIPPAPSPPEADRFPLSYAQEHLWLLHQMLPEEDRAAYNLAAAARLRGRLDPGVLERSMRVLEQRHDALRTVFAYEEGRPLQVVRPGAQLPWAVVEVEGADPEVELERHIREETARAFDLAGGPPARATLFRLSPTDHLLLVVIHHIAADGWSMEVMIREVPAIYRALAEGRDPALPPLPIRYGDYARWERAVLDDTLLEDALAYWRDALRPPLPVCDLPTDRPRPPRRSYRGEVERFTLPVGLRGALLEVGREHSATLFMVLLAGLAALLRRYTGQEDLVVGSPVAGRERPETEGLIGHFLNTLALRIDLSGEPSFAGLLHRVRDTTLSAFARQHVPFTRVVEAVRPERDPGRPTLFQLLFVLRSAMAGEMEIPGLVVTPVDVHPGIATYDLTFSLLEEGEDISGLVSYNADLFDPATVRALLRHWECLLLHAAAAPHEPVARLRIVDTADTPAAIPSERGDLRMAHGAFEAQAARAPGAVAVVCGGRRLTYGELDREAGRLASRLRALGVGAGTLVGVRMQRTPELVAAILGVLKAGGAYVPLDPAYPAARLAEMAARSRLELVLSDEPVDPSAFGGAMVLVLPDEPVATPDAPEPPPPDLPGDALAYVIFTSGSTGIPKAVAMPHASVARYLDSIQSALGVTPEDAYLHVASFSFSSSVRQLLAPLSRGARVVLATREDTASAHRLLELVRTEGVTVLDTVPTLLRQCAQALREADAVTRDRLLDNRLRLIVSSGEMLTWDVVQGWPERIRNRVVMLNVYGQTETIGVSCYPVPHSSEERSGRVPVGSPLAHVRVRILDAQGEPIPTGAPGVLHVAGPGVAAGYLEEGGIRPVLTVPDPFLPGERLYPTGDVARLRSDGTLEIVGRADRQAKVRGVRVDLHEVEGVLLRHPRVQRAVVVAREEEGRTRLVAYVVTAGDVETRELRARVAEALPEYMAPGAFVRLDSLPTSANGKLDYARLPAGGPEHDADPPPAGSLVERVLARVWGEVLGIPEVDPHDNLFEVGGDSIASMEIAWRLGRLGLAVTPRDLFLKQSVVALAAQMREEIAARAAALEKAVDGRMAPDWTPAPGEEPPERAAIELGAPEVERLSAGLAALGARDLGDALLALVVRAYARASGS